MRIPLWIWIILGLTVLVWILPDGIPGSGFILPAIAIVSFLIRRLFMKNKYQQQYQKYQKQKAQGSGSAGGQSQTGSQGSSSFYNRFAGWGSGFQQAPPPPSMKDPYEMLGISKGASIEKIKKAYRDKLKRFHPDVVENLKLGPEYKEMFEEKTREIQKAFEQLGGK